MIITVMTAHERKNDLPIMDQFFHDFGIFAIPGVGFCAAVCGSQAPALV